MINGCPLKTLTIGNNVKMIPTSTFVYCTGLNTVTIPISITSIGDNAFGNCTGLTTVNFNATNCTYMGTSGAEVFSSCSSLKNLFIGNNVTNIPDWAFYHCDSLKTFSIPSTVTSIGKGSFSLTAWYYNQPDGVMYLDNWILGCKGNLPFSINIKLGTKGIAGNAFGTYYNSQSIVIPIPSTVTFIGSSAFSNCTGLTSISSYSTIPISLSTSTNIFGGVNKITCKLYVPKNSVDLYKTANQWMDFTNIIGMETGLNDIELSSIDIYPNPTKEKLTVSLSSTDYVGSNISIFNNVGQQIFTSKLQEENSNFDLSSISGKGTYIVQITNKKGNVIGRKKIILE